MSPDEQFDDLPVQQEPETLSDQLVDKTPWWFMSVFVHAVLFAVCALIVVIARPVNEEEVVVVAAPRTPPPVPDITKPENLVVADKFIDIDKQVEDPVHRQVEMADHTESDDQEDYESMKGESTDFKSDKPFNGQGLNDSIGGGGGGGGRYGTRFGGKTEAVNEGGGSDLTEGAVLEALKWLARHQNPDGSWSMTAFLTRCGAVATYSGTCTPHGIHAAINLATHNFDAGLTGLSLLAFLGSGFDHTSRHRYDGINFGDVVRHGLEYLIRVQDGEGCIGSRAVEQYMYNHCIGALALSEAYGLTASVKFRDAAQRSIDFLIASQNAGKGWRYIYQAGDNDTSVTGWAVMALKSANLSGLNFDRGVAYDGARAWLDHASYTGEAGGTGGTTPWKAGYEFGGDADVYIPGVNDQYDQHPSMTAISVMSRIFIGEKRSAPEVRGGAVVLLKDLPKWDTTTIDFYYWYYGSLALFQYDAPKGPKWKAWNRSMVGALVKSQNTAEGNDKKGSWEPVGRWCCMGGRVYATAINALTLEVYYRYGQVFGGRSYK